MKASKIKEFIFLVILATVMLLGFVAFAEVAVSKEMRVSCYKLQEQSKTFPEFYVTKKQYENCTSLGIVVVAPIKNQ